MRTAIFLSFSIHVGVIMGLFILKNMSSPFKQKVKLFQVQLVSPPPRKAEPASKVEKAAPAEKKPKPVISEKKQPEALPKAVKPETRAVEETPVPTAEASEGKNINVDVKDFPFAYYLYMLQNRIQQNWASPYQVIDQEHDSAVISFQILRNGSIVNISVDKSSGRSVWDRSAQRAIHSLKQLPPLPEDYSGEVLTVHVEFEVR